jgi:DNA-binding NarL/FixJ family response regulator
MASEWVRVGILSASRSWCERITALLAGAKELACIGSAATIAELGRLSPMPDVVIVDGSDPQLLEALSPGSPPPIPRVILSDEPERELAARMLAAGSFALLERSPPPSQLAAAVTAAASGLATLSPLHVANLVDANTVLHTPRNAEWIEPLTPRELQILRMLSDGMPNKSIASELQISEHTAKFHVGQILAKLGAESRTEAVTIGIRRGLVMV